MTPRRAIALAGAAAVAVLVAAAALFVALRASRPRQPTQVVVSLRSPGTSADEMDHEVLAVERQLVSRSFGSLTSVAGEGTACVAAPLDPKDEPLAAAHRAREALESCRASGSTSEPQVVTIVGPSQTIHAALAADAMSLVELRRVARRIAEAAEATNGVRGVEICGGADEEIAIRLDPSAMTARGVGVADVAPDVRSAPRSAEEVAALPIATRSGAPVLVRDVATVARTAVPPPCAVATDDARGRVVLTIDVAWPSDRELETARAAVVRTLEDAARTLPPGVRLDPIDATRALRANLFVTGIDVPPGASLESTLALAKTLRGPGVDAAWLLARQKHASCTDLDAPSATAILRAPPGTSAEALRAAVASRLSPGAVLRRVRRLDDAEAVSRAWIHASSWEDAERVAERARAVIASVPGVTDVGVPARGAPRFTVDPSRATIARFGIAPSDVARAARVALAGEPIGRVRGPDGDLPIVLTLGAGRGSLTALAGVPLRASDGTVVPLEHLVSVRSDASEPLHVRRKLSRASFVRFFAPTRRVLDEVRTRVAKDVALPVGVVVEIEGVTP